nr:PKD-like family lipoprotein [uncultured Marinifilum sp.]
MKNIIYLLLLTICCYSCLDDEGNYDYIDPGTIDFSNMATNLDAMIGENLLIEGNFTTMADESDLKFAWYVTEQDDDGEYYADTLSKSRNFDQLLTLKPGEDVHVIYSVYNTKYDVHFNHDLYIDVVTPFSTGWAILKEKEGKTEFDFYSATTGTHYKDVLETISGVSLEGKPVEIGYNWSPYYDFSALAILTDQGGAFFDPYTMKKEADVLDLFNSASYLNLPFTGGFLGRQAFDSKSAILCAGGKAFLKSGKEYSANYWEAPVEGDYIVTDKICAVATKNTVVFDEKYQRYLLVKNDKGANKMETFIYDETTDAFDPNNLNKDCIWMNANAWDGFSLYGKSTYAVAKDASHYYIQSFTSDWFGKFIGQMEVQIPDGIVNENSQIVNNGVYPYTYFTNGGSIHRFSQTAQAFEQNYMNIGSDIKNIAVDHNGETMAIAIDNGSGSTVILWDLIGNEEIERYDVDSKIFEIVYRNESKTSPW